MTNDLKDSTLDFAAGASAPDLDTALNLPTIEDWVAKFGARFDNDKAKVEVFREKQSELFNETFVFEERKHQLFLIDYFHKKKKFPETPPPPTDKTLDELLPPNPPLTVVHSVAYYQYGYYLVEESLDAEFRLAMEHAAEYDMEGVCRELAALQEGGIGISGPYKTDPDVPSVIKLNRHDGKDSYAVAYADSPEVEWDTTSVTIDSANQSARCAPGTALRHENRHIIHGILYPIDHLVRRYTPSRTHGNFEEVSVMEDWERPFMEAMEAPARITHHGFNSRAVDVVSNKWALSVASLEDDFQIVVNHAATGQIVEIKNDEDIVILNAGSEFLK